MYNNKGYQNNIIEKFVIMSGETEQPGVNCYKKSESIIIFMTCSMHRFF